ncbi:hypothetical protein GCM10010462_16540 [Microbacterium dextranolyticum]
MVPTRLAVMTRERELTGADTAVEDMRNYCLSMDIEGPRGTVRRGACRAGVRAADAAAVRSPGRRQVRGARGSVYARSAGGCPAPAAPGGGGARQRQRTASAALRKVRMPTSQNRAAGAAPLLR